jgi:hypothetical protein
MLEYFEVPEHKQRLFSTVPDTDPGVFGPDPTLEP